MRTQADGAANVRSTIPGDDEWERQRQIAENQDAIALLRAWREDDEESEEEQRQALEELMRAIDEDRPSYRRLFS